jgi:molybdopterin converting factor small subunit
MAIDLRVPTVLQKHSDGQRIVAGNGATVGQLIEDIGRRHENLRAALLDDEGGVHRYINIYVNDEDVRYLGGAATPIEDGDSVSVLPAVAGG